jgi:pyruvate formate lyase activating enzyme
MIKGINKTTLVDYPGELACTIFIAGCNLRCGYCYNSDLVFNIHKIPTIKEEEVIDFLALRRKYLDGVCITGGEPTLFKDIIPLIKKIKKLCYKIKLDTNGTNPTILKELFREKLLDYIAMDVKASLQSYLKVAGIRNMGAKIKESITLIKESGVKYEFRTTIVPDVIDENEMEKISRTIQGADQFFIQQFRPDNKTINPRYSTMEPQQISVFYRYKSIAEKYCKHVGIRNIDNWPSLVEKV